MSNQESLHSKKNFSNHTCCWFVVFLSTVITAYAVNYDSPSGLFRGVNERGEFSLWLPLDKLDISKSESLSISLNFYSKQRSEGLLGAGWSLSIFQSKMVQIDENTFYLFQVDGWIRKFERSRQNPLLLNGEGMWHGKITDSTTIEVEHESGWRYTLKNGALLNLITPQKNTLTLTTSSNSSTIYLNGSKIATLEPRSEVLYSLTYRSKGRLKEALFGLEQRPIISNVKGKPIISGMAPALSKVDIDGNSFVITHSITKDIQPRLKLSNNEIESDDFVWNPITGYLESNGRKKYVVKELSFAEDCLEVIEQTENLITSRIVSNSPYHSVRKEGDGSYLITSYFLRGLLNGKARKTERVSGTSKNLVRKFVYDENASLIYTKSINQNNFLPSENIEYSSKTSLTHLFGMDLLSPKLPTITQK